MPSHNNSTRATHGKRTSLAVGSALWSLLLLLCTSALFAQAPNKPINLTATAGNNKIDLTWSNNSSTVDSVRILRSSTAGGTYSKIDSVDSLNPTSYSNTGLIEGVKWYYRVRTLNTSGASVVSDSAFATVLPDAPSNLDATAVSGTQINIIWTDESSLETAFQLEVSTNNVNGPFSVLANPAANLQAYSSTGLTPNTKYYFRIRANSSLYGNSTYSNVDSATTLPTIPTAPSGLTATAVSSSQINLAWTDNSANEDSFRIERKLSSDITYTQIASVSANTTTYSSTGLASSTLYIYRVRASNAGGNSSYSNTASATTFPLAPNAPTALDASTVSFSQINLTWTDNSTNEDSFRIERSLNLLSGYTPIAIVGANAISYANTGLSSSTKYFYRVLAKNAGGSSVYTNVDSATTDPAPPNAPSVLTATAASNFQINLSWTDNSTDETGFKIEIALVSGGPFTEIATVGANVTTYASTGLDPNKAYFYRVRAYNVSGNSSYSNEATATTLPDAPAAPTVLTATAVSGSQINLAWTDNANNEDGFILESKPSSSLTFSVLTTLGANVTSYSNTGLAAVTGYDYRVRAYNAGGNSGYSNIATATTLPAPPNAPINLIATALSNTKIDLIWNDVANEDSFKIERSLSVSGPFTHIANNPANDTTYCDAGLLGSTIYFYRVRAYNSGGNSGYSNVASDTTLADPPTAPTNLFASSVSNTQIDLSWTDNSNNETGFVITRSLSFGGPYLPVDSTVADDNNFSDTGLSGSTQYFYQVYAYNNTNSSSSNIASATTGVNPPIAPSNLSFSTVGNTQVNLTWTDNSYTEFGFGIERKIGAAGTYTPIDSVGANVTNFSDTGLTSGTTYYYRVFAYNAGGSTYCVSPVEVVVTTPQTPPAAPTTLIANSVSNTQVNLAWTDNSSNEDGFKLERSLNPSSGFVQFTTVGAGVTSFNNTGLSPNTQYYYRVRAYNTGGNSSYSNTAGAMTSPNAPIAPTGLIATGAGTTQVNLTWTDASANEIGFRIKRSPTGLAGSFVQIDSVLANITSYSNTGLTALTTYYYQVYAYNGGGQNGSNVANATTFDNPPAAPSALVATPVSNTQINLLWTDNSANETGFTIKRGTTSGGPYTTVGTVGANATSFFNTGLTANTQYFYVVSAQNAGGNSPNSNDANATTFVDPPAAPSNLVLTVIGSSQINLAWVDNASNEDGFYIERKTGAGSYAQIASVGANVTSYANNTGLSASTQYYYRVRAYNINWSTPYSNEANATTQAVSALGAPTGLTATAVSKTQINLAWSDNASTETGFRIERKIGAGAYSVLDSVAANVTTYNNTGLNANTLYTYRVRATNGASNSAYSNEDGTKTWLVGPSNLVATVISGTQIDLAWTETIVNETGFVVERKTGAAGSYAQVGGTLPQNSTSFSNSGLTAGTQYFYRVHAINATNRSEDSNEANATTTSAVSTPNAPSTLTATAMSKNQINLAWQDNSSNETGFLIERKTGSGGTYAQIGTVGANVITFNNTGLAVNSQYFYRVRATNGSGNSAYSNEANARTYMNGPTNLVATASGTTINLTWTDGIVNETGFIVERKTGVAGSYAQVGATLPQNTTSFSNTGLTASTQYFYRVYGVNSTNRSDNSNEANATTSSTPSTAPGNLTATAVSKNQINLAWQDNSTNETSFLIERKSGSAGSYAQIGTVGANVTVFNNTGLGTNALFFYRVRASIPSGFTAYSNEVSDRTFMNGPTNLVANITSSTQINLTWSESITNETNFQVERGTASGGPFTLIATLAQNSTSYTNTVANTSTTYYYRVRGTNSSNVSEYSNVAASSNSGSSSGSTNLALNKPITASSTYSTSTPTRGNDGNSVSFWRSGNVTAGNPIAWLRVELGASPVTMARVVILWNQFYYATQYEIQVSNDGTNWTIVHTNNSATNATQDVSFTPVSARYVRAYLKMPNTGSYRLVELQVYATGSVTKSSDELAAAEEAVVPESITLEQNYPNPFNPSTTIAFSLPAGVNVSLKVINVTGQEVANLIDGYRDRGNYRVTFKAAKLPTGVYYAVLKAGDVTQIKRMTLAK